MKIILSILLTCIISTFLTFNAQAQVRGGYTTYTEIYRQAERINGHYIPKDLEDAVKHLDSLLTDEEKSAFGWDDIVDQHGMWIREHWYLWSNSRLAVYFKSIGVRHPESMSWVLEDAYHNWRKDKDIRLEEIKERYKKMILPEYLKKDFERFENMGLENRWDDSEMERFGKRWRPRFEKEGLRVGTRLYWIFPHGCSTKKEERILHKTGSYENIAEGVITEIQYYPPKIKVKLTKSTSRHGIIVFDENGNFDNLKNSRDFKKLNIKSRSIYLLPVGNEFWFSLKGAWEPYKESSD
ncbi:MAG: hypothetical protein J6Y40_07130 [Bacteroidales bacterium]|nr:hypothetical protein [Bacteroidales bacterium]